MRIKVLAKRYLDRFLFGLFFYPLIIIFGWLFFGSLELLGVIRIKNRHFIPDSHQGLLLIANHPSFWEPVVLNYLFLRQAALNPFRFFPYSTPDFNNFKQWYWLALRSRFIFFPRGDVRGCAIASARAVRILKRGRIVIMFPEGGRTSSSPPSIRLVSKNGYQLRPLKSGAIRLALRTNCLVLPIWVKGAERVMPRGSRLPRFWRRLDIIIGPAFSISGPESKENIELAKEEIIRRLFNLADGSRV